jgi:hypothetical protein
VCERVGEGAEAENLQYTKMISVCMPKIREAMRDAHAGLPKYLLMARVAVGGDVVEQVLERTPQS